MDRPTVLHVITRLDVGGAQETVLAIAEHAQRHRIEVAAGLGVDPGGGSWDRARRAGIGLHELPALVGPVRPWRDAAAVRQVVALGRALGPVVVQTHSSKAGVIGRVAARRLGVPCVHTVHGWSFNDDQPAVVRGAYVRVERSLAPWTAAFVAVTARDVEIAAAERIGRTEQFHVVRSAIDLTRFRPAPERRDEARQALGVPTDAIVLGTVVRLSPQKDAATLLRAFAEVLAREPAAHLVVIGDGPDRAEVEGQVARSGLGDRVHLVGARPDVADLLAAFDLFLLASRYEGMPRVVIEALASGLPVVASAVGGLAEVIRPGETGRLVPVGDAGAFAAACVEVLAVATTSDGAAAFRAAGVLAAEPFGIPAMVEATERLYDEVRAAHRSGAGAR